MDFNSTKKPDLVLIVMEFFQYDFILSPALFFTIILIQGYIIQYQDMKETLQQFSRNIALGSKEFIERVKEKDGFPFSWE